VQLDSTLARSWLVCNEFCQAKERLEERKIPVVHPRPQPVTVGQDWVNSDLKLQWAERLRTTALPQCSPEILGVFSQGTQEQHVLLHW